MVGRNLIPALTNDRQWESPEAPPPVPSVHDPHDTPLSPVSEASSGYFSTSVSTATLSEASAIASGDPAPLHPSLTPLEAGGLKGDPSENTYPRNPQQQRADRNGVLASPQYDAKMAAAPAAGPPTAHNPSNHNNIAMGNPSSAQRPGSSDLKTLHHNLGEEEEGEGRGGGGGSYERLEIILDDEDGGREYELPDWLRLGACVTVGANKSGAVRYIGNTEFAEGVWVGVELSTPSGLYDGPSY